MTTIKKVFVVRLLFLLIFACNSVQGMKRQPELDRLQVLTLVAAEMLQPQGEDNWYPGLVAETQKKVRREPAPLLMQVSKGSALIIPYKKPLPMSMPIGMSKHMMVETEPCESNHSWHAGVTAIIEKKEKFESALAHTELIGAPKKLVFHMQTRKMVPQMIPQKKTTQEEVPIVLPKQAPKDVVEIAKKIVPVMVGPEIVKPVTIILEEEILHEDELQELTSAMVLETETLERDVDSVNMPVLTKKYKCDQCPFQTIYVYNFTRHVKKQHKKYRVDVGISDV